MKRLSNSMLKLKSSYIIFKMQAINLYYKIFHREVWNYVTNVSLPEYMARLKEYERIL